MRACVIDVDRPGLDQGGQAAAQTDALGRDVDVDVVGPGQIARAEGVGSACHCWVRRVTVAGESSGNTSLTFGDLRHFDGRIAEANRLRSPVASSTR